MKSSWRGNLFPIPSNDSSILTAKSCFQQIRDSIRIRSSCDITASTYSRAEESRRRGNLFRLMVREVAERYGGEVPGTKDELMSLPGVGDYVASAVVCFSSGEPTPIIDTNVVRVIGRIFGLRLEGEARRRKEMRDAATLCLDQRQPRLYNYALLDFAALVCAAGAPRCSECPFGQRGLCAYAQR